MEIRINKQWVIYTSKNGAGVILGKIPENKQDEPDLDVTKLGGSNLHHYATVFGAVQGLFKYGVNDTDARSFAELEAKIERIAQECQSAFIKSQSVQAVPEGFVLVSAEQLSQWGHMANYAEQYGCPECFEARGYAHSLACEINEFFTIEAQEPAND